MRAELLASQEVVPFDRLQGRSSGHLYGSQGRSSGTLMELRADVGVISLVT